MSGLLLRGWRAQLAVIGANGIPPTQAAGNVMLPFTEVKLSIRLPPSKNLKEAERALIKLLTENPPYGAKVTLTNVVTASGFNAPDYD